MKVVSVIASAQGKLFAGVVSIAPPLRVFAFLHFNHRRLLCRHSAAAEPVFVDGFYMFSISVS